MRACAAVEAFTRIAAGGLDSEDMGFLCYPVFHTNAVTMRVTQSEEAENHFEFLPHIPVQDVKVLTIEMLQAMGAPPEAIAMYPV